MGANIQELSDWRGKLDGQMTSYRTELGSLRSTLNTEVEAIRSEFQDLRATLKTQLDSTAKLANQEGSRLAKETASMAIPT